MTKTCSPKSARGERLMFVTSISTFCRIILFPAVLMNFPQSKKVIDASGRVVKISLTNDVANADTPILPACMSEAPIIQTLNIFILLIAFHIFDECLRFVLTNYKRLEVLI